MPTAKSTSAVLPPLTLVMTSISNAGVPKPIGTQAHHIVGKTTPEGKRTQTLLKRLDIDVNSPTNGVFLPGCGSSNAAGMMHYDRHTRDYEIAIRDCLENVRSKQEAISELQKIREELLDNTFTPLNRRSQ